MVSDFIWRTNQCGCISFKYAVIIVHMYACRICSMFSYDYMKCSSIVTCTIKVFTLEESPRATHFLNSLIRKSGAGLNSLFISIQKEDWSTLKMNDIMTWSSKCLVMDNISWFNGFCGERGQISFLATF